MLIFVTSQTSLQQKRLPADRCLKMLFSLPRQTVKAKTTALLQNAALELALDSHFRQGIS